MFSTFQLLGVFLPSSSTNKRHKETTRSKTLAITYLMLCCVLCRVLLGLPLGLHGSCELDPHVHGAVSIPYAALYTGKWIPVLLC